MLLDRVGQPLGEHPAGLLAVNTALANPYGDWSRIAIASSSESITSIPRSGPNTSTTRPRTLALIGALAAVTVALSVLSEPADKVTHAAIAASTKPGTVEVVRKPAVDTSAAKKKTASQPAATKPAATKPAAKKSPKPAPKPTSTAKDSTRRTR